MRRALLCVTLATFTRPGTYTFRCAIYPSMTQTIVVSNQAKFR